MLTNDGTIDSVLSTMSEANAEIARYAEYLYLEKKWNSSVNMSSATHLGALIGRKPRRAVSAIGYILVSHTDIYGVNRLNNLGNYFFNINAPSDFDDITQIDTGEDASLSRTLVPWVSSDVYMVPKGTRALTDDNIEFITTQNMSIKVLTDKWSSIVNSTTKLDAFYKSGGWNGIKYLKIPVIQGRVKTIEFGQATRIRFETFKIAAPNVEDASNSISAEYLRFIITLSNDKTEEWVMVPNISLCGPYDKAFEAITSDDGTFTLLRVGDGVTGSLLPENSRVTVQYLETLGEGGNLRQKYAITKLVLPAGYSMIDPRTGTPSNFLSCTNNIPILGGREGENEDDYKTEAPISYLNAYTTSTIKSYESYIRKNSPVSFLHLKLYSGTKQDEKTISEFNSENELFTQYVQREFLTLNNVLKISAVGTDGNAIPNAYETFIQPLSSSLEKQKSPFDSFEYESPNFIDLRVGLIVSTKDLVISDQEIEETVKMAVDSNYGSVNTDFEQPVYTSKIVEQAKLFPFSESVSTIVEAKATTYYDKESVNLYTTQKGVEIIAIPFRFDKLFGINAYQRGFKNYKLRSPYLLKIDLQFINNSTAASVKNRTLFLYDERYKDPKASDASVNNAKLIFNGSNLVEKDWITSTPFGRIVFLDETKEGFENRNVRVAQFEYINKIITDETSNKIKRFDSAPYEIRPFEIDNIGKNILFDRNDVDVALRSVPEGGSGSLVYKINTQFIDNVDIAFYENYDNYESDNFAYGCLFLPLDYLGFSQYLNRATTTTEKLSTLEILLDSFFRVNVYALPLLEDINPLTPKDFISFKDENILVEVKRLV
jgi:hypothetical protein